jgi:hypothetical protein
MPGWLRKLRVPPSPVRVDRNLLTDRASDQEINWQTDNLARQIQSAISTPLIVGMWAMNEYWVAAIIQKCRSIAIGSCPIVAAASSRFFRGPRVGLTLETEFGFEASQE